MEMIELTVEVPYELMQRLEQQAEEAGLTVAELASLLLKKNFLRLDDDDVQW